MFTIQNYPKSFGNTKQGYYRLKDIQRTNTDIKKIESIFWEFISTIAASGQSRNIFKSYQFIDAGWEWSTFRKNPQTVIKIPSGIFTEVGHDRYLDNIEFAYQNILKYFQAKFVTKTTFVKHNDLNTIEQTYVDGKNNDVIGYNTKNLRLLSNIKIFLESALNMLDQYQWLPDFDIRRSSSGFVLRNVIIESNIPKIIDFTAYYDVYRLYKQKTVEEVKDKSKHISDFLNWIVNREISINMQGDVALS